MLAADAPGAIDDRQSGIAQLGACDVPVNGLASAHLPTR